MTNKDKEFKNIMVYLQTDAKKLSFAYFCYGNEYRSLRKENFLSSLL